ncbi:hypothetical protein TNCV_1401911 [Trichonephila clavipes]|nr:hypothetical protein TNCV_1401911 [Trichonephila clavipes]
MEKRYGDRTSQVSVAEAQIKVLEIFVTCGQAMLYQNVMDYVSAPKPLQARENAMANEFWVSVRNNISKRWNTTENDVSKNQSSADSAIRLPNTSILNSNAADITEYFFAVPNCIILNIL